MSSQASNTEHERHVSKIVFQGITVSDLELILPAINEQALPQTETSSALPPFEYLAEFSKSVIAKIYEQESVTNIVYKTILSQFKDADDIVDDLEDKTCSYIITKIERQIIENDDILYPWNDEDNNNLYEILTMIYKDGITDINRYDKKVFEVDSFTEKVIMIAKDINKNWRNKIPIHKLRELLQNEKLNEASLRNTTQDIMEQMAKKYDIKPHHAMKILSKLKAEDPTPSDVKQQKDEKEMEFSTNEEQLSAQLSLTQLDRSYSRRLTLDDGREHLETGSLCRVYSVSGRKWVNAQVTDVTDDDEKESDLLTLQYIVNNITKSKQIRRDNNFISAVSTYQDDDEDDDELPIYQKMQSVPVNMMQLSPTLTPEFGAGLQYLQRNVSWGANVKRGRRSRAGTEMIENKAERVHWKVGTKCETLMRCTNKWIVAEIIKLFIYDEKEWLLLKCSDNTLVEVNRYSLRVRSIAASKSTMMLSHKRNKSARQLKAMFDQIMMEKLMSKLKQVLDGINHEIDANQRFLYQIYYFESAKAQYVEHEEDETQNKQIRRRVTYKSDKAMKIYHSKQKHKYPTVLLCNGKLMGSYGNRSICDKCKTEANDDYDKVKSFVHNELLDVKNIEKKWADKYDQKQLLAMQREEIIKRFTDRSLFNITTIQIAINLYEKLIAILKSDQKSTVMEVFEEDQSDVTESDVAVSVDAEYIYNDIMFLWTKKEPDIKTLDSIHFLYIVSLILCKLTKQYQKVDAALILRCLYDIQMNGLLFNSVEDEVFIRSVLMHSHSYDSIEVESFHQLMQCVEELYDEIKEFDLSTIKPSSICNVSLSKHSDKLKIKKDDEKEENIEISDDRHEPKDVPIFEQWMTTFSAKYNRNTAFHFDVFADLMNVYNDDGTKNIIIAMKYDNYSTDLNRKRYDHVLKSFISWAITIKCSNLRCNEKPKLSCFCDPKTFQMYTYNIIMALIGLKANHNDTLLRILSDPKEAVARIVKAFCEILRVELQENLYYKSYQLLVTEWINFEFYNFVCNYCHHVNKSIMIGRIYEYSKSLDSCRICSKQQISRIINSRPQFDINEAMKEKNSAIRELYEKQSEFTLYSLNEYLTKRGVKKKDIMELNAHLALEEYDSDGVIDDIEDDENGSNIKLNIDDNCYYFVRKFLNYHRYPTYKNGKLIRYLVLKPKFFSLVKEICLNGIYPLSIEKWQLSILPEVFKEYDHERKTMYCRVTDKRFGVEEGEAMGINHLIAIFMFTDTTTVMEKYRSFFSKSYYLWHKAVHYNNFYWVGRYLYEAVQFYGKSFPKNGKNTILYKGLHKIKSFDSLALTINSATLTTDIQDNARRFAGNKGFTFGMVPKYRGDIDNSKFLQTTLFNKKILLLKGTKVQLRSIRTIDPAENLDQMVLAIQYIEKIFLQTTFDMHFYNTSNLYTAQNMKTAYRLLMAVVNNKWEFSYQQPYLRHLFENWCFKREFVTFETFRMEMHFMSYKLKQFLFDEEAKRIKIENVKKFLPNLKHYHDIDGILRNVNTYSSNNKSKDEEQATEKVGGESIGLLYNCQHHDIPYHVVNALENINYKFEQCPKVLSRAFRIQLSKLDLDIDCKSFRVENKKDFTKQLCSIGITEQIATKCIDAVNKKHCDTIHERTETDDLIQWILDELDANQWKDVECDAVILKEAFKKMYSTKLIDIFTEPIMKREKVTAKDLYKKAKDCEKIFNCDEAMILSKYLYIKMMDDKEKVRQWICGMCKFLNCKRMVDGLWRYYNESNECGLCGVSRSEIDNLQANQKEDETLPLYKLRRKRTSFYYSKRNISLLDDNKALIDIDEWEECDDSECKLFKSVNHLSNNQLIYLLKHHFIEHITKKKAKDKLLEQKESIADYFLQNHINGRQFSEINKKLFTKNIMKHCDDKKLRSALPQLHKAIAECDLTKINDLPAVESTDDETFTQIDIYADCTALQRVTIVLKNFTAATDKLQGTNDVYSLNMHSFISSFPEYNAVLFLNDIDHIIRHKFNHDTQKCENCSNCIHYKRATRDRNSKQCKTLHLKKQFFNTDNPPDFVYISMLDRAHCLLYHSADIMKEGKKMKQNVQLMNQDAKEIRHIRYNTGVYMEYHTLKPLYQNLFDEIVGNHACEITEDQFYSELEAAKIFLKTDNKVNKWSACTTDLKYGIKVNEPMHIEHVLCIKFYCNYSNHCESFRKSYRAIRASDTKDDIIRRHCNDHYWFGRFLTAAIEFWGEIPRKSDQFYHGLSGKFVFDHFSTVYEIPTSTTWDITVAQNFSQSTVGIVLKLSPKYTNAVNNSRCLDVSGLSEFEAEKEKLFAGMTVLSITNIYNPSDNGWEGYSDYVAAFLYFERIIEQTNQQKHHYNYGQLTRQKQELFLVPLLQRQMKKDVDANGDDDEKEDNDDIPRYVCILFEHFCDNKRDYIDLSCINEEIPQMHESLTTILFQDIKYSEDEESRIVQEYKICNKNIKKIFPNLVEYKNHRSNWIYVAGCD